MAIGGIWMDRSEMAHGSKDDTDNTMRVIFCSVQPLA